MSRGVGHHGPPTRIVAIGASAGGLAPLEELVAAIPMDSGNVYIIAQHLLPEVKSRLHAILQQRTEIPVRAAEGASVQLEANLILAIPADVDAEFTPDHRLTCHARDGTELRRPIDRLFESMATVYSNRCVAVILSGAGSDGSAGAQAVHAAGGSVVIQQPQSAQFESMPQHALETGCYDRIVLPSEVPTALNELDSLGALIDPLPRSAELAVQSILARLHVKCGIDFTNYRPATIRRRIERRRERTQQTNLETYASFLADDPTECDRLLDDLLINVTRFFRDTAAFVALRSELPAVLKRAAEKGELRVWISACSTGEEAYTIAILIDETRRALGLDLRVRIFATDVDRDAIDQAAAGRYGAEITGHVTEDRLHYYFRKTPDGFRVSQQLHQMLVFSAHDVLTSPPFTNIDLAACRNLLIYFHPSAQERVLGRLQFALNPGGLLLLGQSESLGRFVGEFEGVSEQFRLFRKREQTTRSPRAHRAKPIPPTPTIPTTSGSKYDNLFRRLGVGGLVISSDGIVQQVIAGPQDLFPSLEVGQDALQAVPDELLVPLQKGLATNPPPRLPVELGHRTLDSVGRSARYTIESVGRDRSARPLYLIAGRVNPRHNRPESTAEPAPGVEVSTLARELELAKESMDLMVAQLRERNDDLTTANDSLNRSNEALQNANEELQSVNEELRSINEEYHRKISELYLATNDLENVLRSSEVGFVFVDSKLVLRRFTPRATSVFRLQPHDIGRSLEDIQARAPLPKVSLLAQEVIHGNRPYETKTQDSNGRWLLVRLLPYKQSNSRTAGMVMLFFDIDDQQRAFEQARTDRVRYERIVARQTDPVLRLYPDLRVSFASELAARWLGRDSETIVGTSFSALFGADEARIASWLEAKTEPRLRVQLPRHDPSAPEWVEWSIAQLTDHRGDLFEYQILGRDVQSTARLDERLQRSIDQYARLYSAAPVMLHSIDAHGRLLTVSDYWLERMGYARNEVIGHRSTEFLTPASRELAANEVMPQFRATGECRDVPYEFITKTGEVLSVWLTATAERVADGSIERSFAVITPRTSEQRP